MSPEKRLHPRLLSLHAFGVRCSFVTKEVLILALMPRRPHEQALETLTETAGRFQLNMKFPIPFNGRGTMEADRSKPAVVSDSSVDLEKSRSIH